MLSTVLTVITAGLLGGYGYLRAVDLANQSATEALAGETRLIALRLEALHANLAGDLFIMRTVPPIMGLLRALQNGGLDPSDGSTTQAWKGRLETILSSQMVNNPAYSQLSFVGLWDGGRELVKVQRRAGLLSRAANEQLMATASEPYSQQAQQLEQGQTLFAGMFASDRFGSDTATAVLVQPVHYLGTKVGFVVLKANYAKLLEQALGGISSEKDVIVVSPDGTAFLKHHGTDSIEVMSEHDPDSIEFGLRAGDFKRELLLQGSEETFYFVKSPLPFSGPDGAFTVVTRASNAVLFAGVHEVKNATMMVAAALALLCLSVSAAFAGLTTKPLKDLTLQIKSATSHDDIADLPVTRGDEIGDLSRALLALSHNVVDSNVRAQQVLDNISEGIFVCDEFGRVSSANPALVKLLGLTEGEILRSRISINEHNSRFELLALESNEIGVAVQPGLFTWELSWKMPGTLVDRDVVLSINSVEIADVVLFTGVLRDITEQKRIDRMKSEFISIVSHELRTPITSIRGALSLLNYYTKSSSDEMTAKLLGISLKNCERLSKLVEDILDLEKIESGRSEFKLEVLNVAGLLSECIESNSGYFDSFGVSAELKLDCEDAFCRIDGPKFKQIVENLLSNAVKFSERGGLVTFSVMRFGERHVRVSVADEGEGIPEEFHSLIYQKFSQADSTSTRNKGGSGLGLSIAKSFVEEMGGQITFQTRVGQGTTFSIDFPIVMRPARSQEMLYA